MADINVLAPAWQWIDAHPEEHDQSSWTEVGECGTTRCMAGTIAWLGGAKLVDIDADVNIRRDPTKDTIEYSYCEVNGEVTSINKAATIMAGLSQREADRLFYMATSVEDLRREIIAITHIDPATWEVPKP